MTYLVGIVQEEEFGTVEVRIVGGMLVLSQISTVDGIAEHAVVLRTEEGVRQLIDLLETVEGGHLE